ncbi:MAG: FUSC family protein [Oscillospiraceae bacterium]|nr:FUSC family protein [Oscillospiraceae bacterium]
MKLKEFKLHIGLRTVKTTVAVIVAMLIVDALGATTSKLIFAMLGAMAAVQPTFKESLESCLTQIIGVIFGALMGIILLALKLPSLVVTAAGIILVITLYNALHISFSPSLPCFIVVMLSTTPDIQPVVYAAGRIWDTTIGLAVGMLINMLVFPYDNSQRIRLTAESLDKNLIAFLEDMFDGDDILPNSVQMQTTIDDLSNQLKIFANQKLLMRLKRQQEELEIYNACQQKARALVAQMEVLCALERPGRLNDENKRRLKACGAEIKDERVLDSITERDVVTNYHVAQILTLRLELLDHLGRKRM